MNNNWNESPKNNHAIDNQDGARSGDLLREYRQNQQPSSQSPESQSPDNLKPSTLSGNLQGNGRSGPLSSPGAPPRTRLAPIGESSRSSISDQETQQNFFSSTIQMVQRLTGAMTALNRFTGKVSTMNQASYEPPPPPMVLYHPQDVPEASYRSPIWRRSRALRTSMRMRQRRYRFQNSGFSIQKIVLTIVLVFLVLLVAAVSSGSAYAYSFYQKQLPQVANIAHKQINQVSRLYDRNGVFLGNVYDVNGAGRRTYVDISSIPKVMQDAMVAAENRTFWTDSGIDPQGITRAAIDYVSHGFTVDQGASTLTQQLVKDMTGNDQVTLNRKVNEAAVAIGLTQQYPKSKILEMYLNVAPFGNLRLGVETAAQEYFGLSRQCTQNLAKGTFQCIPAIAQLDYDPVTKTHSPVLALARATFLASLPQNPAEYDPSTWPTHPEFRQIVLDRQQSVLEAMRSMGTLVQGIGPNGQAGPVTPAIEKQVSTIMDKMTFQSYQNNVKDPDFFYWTISQAEIALGHGNSAEGAVALMNGGYNIRTTIDSNLEAYVERVIDYQLDAVTPQKFLPTPYAILSKQYNVGDAAAVVMNSKTGEILAMAGSKDYNNKAKDPRVAGQFNVVTDGLGRQPGSSFKPVVYATAFEMGMYPGMVLPDVRTYFPNGVAAGTSTTAPTDQTGVWVPNDYGDKPNNLVLPLRDDLADSYNIPAGKVMAFAGANNVYNTASRMGITAIQQKGAPCIQKQEDLRNCGMGTAMTLGTTEVPLIQMAGAYQVFADQGNRVPQQSILDIWDNFGNHLYHFDPNNVQKSQVISPQIAYMITAMMADEPARYREFLTDHDLSFYDWDPTCTTKTYAPYPDCAQHQVAAKTGTTDDFKDNLTLGYTPDVVVAVWAGNANGEPLAPDVVGITGAAPIWHSIIERVSGKPCVNITGLACGPLDVNSLGLSNQGTFTNPGGLETKCVSPVDGLMATSSTDCDLMIPGEEPLQSGVSSTVSQNNQGGNNQGGNNQGGQGGGGGGQGGGGGHGGGRGGHGNG
ncbi:MAG TPA: transglycosylase domain-containing protein [Ktedonobacteraceae bacterium]|nr:transglycosylase domain-containing protein [Ktedonobacteraceae bacterium]